MDRRCVEQLVRVNRSFYERSALTFARSRRGIWHGWRMVLDRFESERASPESLILDLGCGNARLVELLAQRLSEPFHYVGVDASEHLLAEARQRRAGAGSIELLHHDLLAQPLAAVLGERRFDLVVAFGLLHHLPGFDRRRELLAAMTSLLADRGLLAVSFWDFRRARRLRDRIVDWRRLAEQGGPRIDEEALEPGDHLLRFGDDPKALRYCHFASADEKRRLLDGLDLQVVADFRADGRERDLNHYFIGTRKE